MFSGPDSLFTATETLPVMLSVANDPVQNPHMKNVRFHFKERYPEWLDNPDIKGIRIQNKVISSLTGIAFWNN